MVHWDELKALCTTDTLRGCGAYGNVYEVSYESKKYAVKVPPPSGNDATRDEKIRGSLIKEVQYLSKLKHQNVVELSGFCMKDGFDVVILTEYCENGNLEQFWRNPVYEYSAVTILHFAIHLIDALAYLHENNICHRDIKPLNILLDRDFNAKLCDFGIAKIIADPQMSTLTFNGTRFYMAPEMLKDAQTSPKGDIFAIGLVLWVLTHRKQWRISEPCTDFTLLQYYEQHSDGVPIEDMSIESQQSKLGELIMGCTKLHEEERWTAVEVRTTIEELFKLPYYAALQTRGWKPQKTSSNGILASVFKDPVTSVDEEIIRFPSGFSSLNLPTDSFIQKAIAEAEGRDYETCLNNPFEDTFSDADATIVSADEKGTDSKTHLSELSKNDGTTKVIVVLDSQQKRREVKFRSEEATLNNLHARLLKYISRGKPKKCTNFLESSRMHNFANLDHWQNFLICGLALRKL